MEKVCKGDENQSADEGLGASASSTAATTGPEGVAIGDVVVFWRREGGADIGAQIWKGTVL